nr:hypothetical protein [Alicyclobacillus fastidiosus]
MSTDGDIYAKRFVRQGLRHVNLLAKRLRSPARGTYLPEPARARDSRRQPSVCDVGQPSLDDRIADL